MAQNERQAFPALTQWFRDNLSESAFEFVDQMPLLTAILLLAGRSDAPPIPDDVLSAWRALLVRERRTVDQSEAAFFEAARDQGKSWRHIAEVLGYPTPEDAQQRWVFLIGELRRTHPGTNPRPWLP